MMEAIWLRTLTTETPEFGNKVEIKLSRMVVKLNQPDAGVREKLRPFFENDANALITMLQAVAAADKCWRYPSCRDVRLLLPGPQRSFET